MSKAADIARVFETGSKEAWKPKNYGGGFQGYITLKDALRQSRNLATINLLSDVGLDVVHKRLVEIGFKNIPANLSIALGSYGISPLEFSKFYSMFSNGGEIVEPLIVRKVIAPNHLETIYEPDRLIASSPEQIYLMTDMLKTVVSAGTGRGAITAGVQVAGKTGTTNNNIDAWFCGFTPEIQAIIWYGNDDNTPMRKIEGGGRTAAPVFRVFMEDYLKYFPQTIRNFTEPEGVSHAIYNGKDELYTTTSPLPRQGEMENLIEQDNDGIIF